MENRTKNRKTWKRILIWLLVVALTIFLLLIAFGSWHAFLRPVPVPSFDSSAGELLLKTRNNTSAAPTSSTLARNDSATSLTYQPFIPLTNDLPTSLVKERDRINARIDEVYRKIAQYERDKSNMDFKSSWAMLNQIWNQYQAAMELILNATDHPATYINTDRQRQFCRWYDQERVEVGARHQNWKMAALMTSEYYRGLLVSDREDHYELHPTEPYAAKAEFELKWADRAWDQEVYYWRQMGGVEGYGRIGTGAIERSYEQWLKKAPQPIRGKLPSRLDLN